MKKTTFLILFIFLHLSSFGGECFQTINTALKTTKPQFLFIVKIIDGYIQNIENLHNSFSRKELLKFSYLEKESNAISHFLKVKRRKYQNDMQILQALDLATYRFNELNNELMQLYAKDKISPRTLFSEDFKTLIANYKKENSKLLLGLVLPHVKILSARVPNLLGIRTKLLIKFINTSPKLYKYLYNYKVDSTSHNEKRWIFVRNFPKTTLLSEIEEHYLSGKYQEILNISTFLIAAKLQDEITLQVYFPKGLTPQAREYFKSKFSVNIQLL